MGLAQYLGFRSFVSTKCTIVSVNALHIYEEVLSEEICIDLDRETYPQELKINEKYGDIVLSMDELKELYLGLRKFLNCPEINLIGIDRKSDTEQLKQFDLMKNYYRGDHIPELQKYWDRVRDKLKEDNE